MKLRPLGTVREIVESAGSTITYFYDDLIFGDNNLFILQFIDTKNNQLNLFFNTDCDKSVALTFEAKLKKAATDVKFSIQNKGLYSINQKKDGEKLEIVFV